MRRSPQHSQLANGAQRHTGCTPGTYSAELHVCCFQPVLSLRIVEHCISKQVCYGPTAALLSASGIWHMPLEDVRSLLSAAVLVAGLH